MKAELSSTTLLAWQVWAGMQLLLCLAPSRCSHAWIAFTGESAELIQISAFFFVGRTRDRYRRRLLSLIIGRLALHLWCSRIGGDDEIQIVA